MHNRDQRLTQRVEYDDDLWLLCVPHPALSDLLEAKDRLIVIRHGEPPYAVTLGVPHHATAVEDYICEKRLDERGELAPRDADKNVASYALVAFTALRDRDISCKLVIMAHATGPDPNKDLNSPYCREIFAEAARLLLECHASGPQRRLALELSAGHNAHADVQRFARLLDAVLGCRYTWGAQMAAGASRALIFGLGGQESAGELELSALNTASLVEAARRRMPALHIEAKPAFCKPPDLTNTVTPDGLILGRALAWALRRYLL